MKCLNCGEEMRNRLVLNNNEHLQYDACEACGSMWLDAGELDKMAFDVKGSIEFCSTDKAEAPGEAAKDCPRCDGVAMDKVKFIGSDDVILDRCDSCGGFWLDGGELDLINRRLEKIMPVQGKGFSGFVTDAHLAFWNRKLGRLKNEKQACDVPPVKHAVKGGKSEKICPVCKAPTMDNYKMYGVNIEACSECDGMWLHQEELRDLKDKAGETTWGGFKWMDDEVDGLEETLNAVGTSLLCPYCKTERLFSVKFGDSDIIVEWCPHCKGVWLARGEFDDILEYLKEKQNSITSEELKGQALQEIKEVWDGPEDKLSEIRDAGAALSALINLNIFEHPRLANALVTFSKAVHSIGF